MASAFLGADLSATGVQRIAERNGKATDRGRARGALLHKAASAFVGADLSATGMQRIVERYGKATDRGRAQGALLHKAARAVVGADPVGDRGATHCRTQ